MAKAGRVYRFGSATDDALTPRPGKDTSPLPGQQPGLSVWEDSSPDGGKVQKIDVAALLPRGLAYLPDDPPTAPKGHGVIAPITPSGEVDLRALEEWASWRRTGKRHRFTQAVLDAIIEADVRSSS
jgi:hypothetical protein